MGGHHLGDIKKWPYVENRHLSHLIEGLTDPVGVLSGGAVQGRTF